MASKSKSIGEKEYKQVLSELSTACKNIQTSENPEMRSELVAKAIKAADQLGTSTIQSTATTNALSIVVGVKAHKALEELATARETGDDIAIITQLIKDMDTRKCG